MIDMVQAAEEEAHFSPIIRISVTASCGSFTAAASMRFRGSSLCFVVCVLLPTFACACGHVCGIWIRLGQCRHACERMCPHACLLVCACHFDSHPHEYADQFWRAYVLSIKAHSSMLTQFHTVVYACVCVCVCL